MKEKSHLNQLTTFLKRERRNKFISFFVQIGALKNSPQS